MAPTQAFDATETIVVLTGSTCTQLLSIWTERWPNRKHSTVDDLLPQPSWPKSHAEKVPPLIRTLEEQ